MTTQAVYYRDAAGHEPVNEWIDDLPPKVQVRVDDATDLLNDLPDDAPPSLSLTARRSTDRYVNFGAIMESGSFASCTNGPTTSSSSCTR